MQIKIVMFYLNVQQAEISFYCEVCAPNNKDAKISDITRNRTNPLSTTSVCVCETGTVKRIHKIDVLVIQSPRHTVW
jgi:archaellum component FlaF (FlaF/FlaG flagellin family)